MTNTARKLLEEIRKNGSVTKRVDTYNIDGQPKNNKRFFRAMWELLEAKMIDMKEITLEQTRSTFESPSVLKSIYTVTLGTGLRSYS